MDSDCVYCGQRAPAGALFCARCGGALGADSPDAVFARRVDVIRHLLRTRAWEGSGGAQIVAAQVQLAQDLLQQHPGADSRSAESLRALGRELLVVDTPPDLVHWIPVATTCLKLFRQNQATAVRDRMAVLKGFADRLTAEEKRLGRDNPANAAAAVSAWLTAAATTCTLGREEARSHLLAAPHIWPRLAAALDPTIRDRAKVLYLVAEGGRSLRAKDMSAALSRFRSALEVDPRSLPALEGAASVHVRLRQIDEAMPFLREAVAQGTRDAYTLNNYAWFSCTEAAVGAKDLPACRAAAERAVELAPIASCWDTLAEVLQQMGDVRPAIAAVREAIRDRPDRSALRQRMETLCRMVWAHAEPSDVGIDLSNDVSLEGGLSLEDSDACASGVLSDPELCCELAADDCDTESVPSADGPDSGVADDDCCAALPAADSAPAATPRGRWSSLWDSVRGKSPAPAVPEPASVGDDVQFTVTAPAVMGVGTCCVVEVWAHIAMHRDRVLELAREAQGGGDLRVKSKPGVQIARGAKLVVQLSIRGLEVPDPREDVVWSGDIVNASFPVEVPADARPGSFPATVTIRADNLPLAKIHFLVTVGPEAVLTPQAPSAARPYASAFASYASRDRDHVLARIQGIQKVLPGLDVFLDVASLHSGQNWQERLVGEIKRRDVFFLFWSEAASTSPWVEREWRMALQHKGIQAIDPIPLVSPEVVTPPPELAGDLHFNDWVLAYMRGAT